VFAETVREGKADTFPTAAGMLTVPVPAVSTNGAEAELIVLLKPIFAPVPEEAVVLIVMVKDPPRVTAPVSVTAPFFVKIENRLIAFAETENAPKGLANPIGPKEAVFAAVIDNPSTPAVVALMPELRLTFPPLPEALIVRLPDKVTDPNVTVPLESIVISPPRVVAPE
jgi:hypothetical protein